jgi:transposase-like protein
LVKYFVKGIRREQMKRRRWDSKTKTKIVLEGLSGRPVSEICNEYGIHQNQYYLWRDKFLSEAHKAFDSKKDVGEIERLRKKNKELTQIIGSLTIELKKTEDEYI